MYTNVSEQKLLWEVRIVPTAHWKHISHTVYVHHLSEDRFHHHHTVCCTYCGGKWCQRSPVGMFACFLFFFAQVQFSFLSRLLIPGPLVLMWDTWGFQMEHSACGQIRCWQRLQAFCDFSQLIQHLCERWPSEGLHLRSERKVWLLIWIFTLWTTFIQQAKNNCNLVLLCLHKMFLLKECSSTSLILLIAFSKEEKRASTSFSLCLLCLSSAWGAWITLGWKQIEFISKPLWFHWLRSYSKNWENLRIILEIDEIPFEI